MPIVSTLIVSIYIHTYVLQFGLAIYLCCLSFSNLKFHYVCLLISKLLLFFVLFSYVYLAISKNEIWNFCCTRSSHITELSNSMFQNVGQAPFSIDAIHVQANLQIWGFSRKQQQMIKWWNCTLSHCHTKVVVVSVLSITYLNK